MNPGSILIGLAMLIATIPWVVAPILNRKRMPEPKDDAQAQEGDSHTEGLMALRDLDFDHRTGKVSEEDYINLRANLLARVAATLEADEKKNANLDDQLEEKIRSHRQNKQASKICSQCGSELKTTDRFCSICGAAADQACTNCGHNLKAGDSFCSACGKPVAVQKENTPPVSAEGS